MASAPAQGLRGGERSFNQIRAVEGGRLRDELEQVAHQFSLGRGPAFPEDWERVTSLLLKAAGFIATFSQAESPDNGDGADKP